MKVFVIKNEKGEYFMDSICFANFSPYIQNATIYYYKPECIDIIEERTLKDCTIVPITICEGDLEEENRVLKKALLEIQHSYGCVSEVCVDESKREISSKKAVDKIRSYLYEMDFAFDDIKDKLGVDYFIKARKQQAKESEKDERD